jgi:hypothetical protein
MWHEIPFLESFCRELSKISIDLKLQTIYFS